MCSDDCNCNRSHGFNLSGSNYYPIFSKSPSSLPCFSTPTRIYKLKSRALSSVQEFPSNALRRMTNLQWRGRFRLGVDLGLSRTNLALSKVFFVRPLTVLKL